MQQAAADRPLSAGLATNITARPEEVAALTVKLITICFAGQGSKVSSPVALVDVELADHISRRQVVGIARLRGGDGADARPGVGHGGWGGGLIEGADAGGAQGDDEARAGGGGENEAGWR